MTIKIQCPNCNMTFSDNTRLDRHVKKAHPTKRRSDPKPSSDFNHAHINFTHFSASGL